jgi:hypothetical protein
MLKKQKPKLIAAIKVTRILGRGVIIEGWAPGMWSDQGIEELKERLKKAFK